MIERVAPPALARLLERAPTPGFEHHWEGEFTGSHGASRGSVIQVKARIGFHGEMLEGSGRAVNFPAELADVDPAFSISGTICGGVASFQLWFAGPPFGREPWVCSGQLSSDGRELTGDWSFRCFNPGTCDCNGGGGEYRLRRID